MQSILLAHVSICKNDIILSLENENQFLRMLVKNIKDYRYIFEIKDMTVDLKHQAQYL